jgi:hypothetical protein
MSGPPPKDAKLRRRRNATAGFKLLPHEGRAGKPPAWPLPVSGDNFDELEYWTKLWSLPQAIEWERMRCEEIVALYVRTFVAAALSADDPKLLAEARQLDAKIGLSPKAMKDLHWETDEPLDEEDEPAPADTVSDPRVYIPKNIGGEAE